MKHLIYIFALLVICSCNNDISLPDAVGINISVSYPDDVDNSTISAGEVVFHNVSTGADTHHAVTGSITTVNLLQIGRAHV